MSRKIPLTKGKFALVDDEDYEYLNQFKWHYSSTGYAVRDIQKNGKRTSQRMHRIVNQTPDGMQTDHRNHNTLDNRKDNLRTCTALQNNKHGTSRKNSTSKYLGVHWDKKSRKWRANIRVNRILIHLGYYDSEEDAALFYNKAAEKYHGEFASLNEIT